MHRTLPENYKSRKLTETFQSLKRSKTSAPDTGMCGHRTSILVSLLPFPRGLWFLFPILPRDRMRLSNTQSSYMGCTPIRDLTTRSRLMQQSLKKALLRKFLLDQCQTKNRRSLPPHPQDHLLTSNPYPRPPAESLPQPQTANPPH